MDDLHLREIQSLTEAARQELNAKEYQALVDFSYVDTESFRSAERKCHQEKVKAVIAYHRMINKERVDESQKKWHLFLSKTLKWLLPVTPAKFWGAVYALDLPYLHDELNPTEKARAIGCTRAAISFQMQDFAKFLKMEPSRWMRDDEAVKNSREARMEDDV